MTPRAQMTQRADAGNWCIYVAIVPGRVGDWPDYDWPVSHRSIPTIGERDKALKRLGYQRNAEAWEWQEYESTTGRVKLFASIEVLPE